MESIKLSNKGSGCFAGCASCCFIMLVIISLALSGCALSGSRPMKAGVVIPLTGDASVYGKGIRQAIDLAKEDLKDDQVEVIYEDACLAPDALKSAQKLVMVDEVDFITGVFCIPSVLSMAPVTKPAKDTIMMTASVPDSIIDSGAFVFSPNSAIKDEAAAQAEFAFNSLHARKAAVLWMNSDFGKGYSDAFSQRFAALGGMVVHDEPLEFFGSDYRTDIMKAKDKDPDVLLAVHFGTQMGLILRQKMEIGFAVPTIGTYEAEDGYIIDSAKGGAQGLYLSSPVGGSAGSAYLAFQERFLARYGSDPSVVAAMAYDGFMLQVKAFKDCGGQKDCMIDSLGSVKDYDGASGIFSITSQGTGQRSFIFKQVRDGKYVLV